MIIDIIISLLLVFAVVMGIRKGFVAQLMSIIAFVLGVWLSCRFGKYAGDWMAGLFGADIQLMRIIAFIVIFVAVILLLTWLARLIEKIFKLLLLGWLNRLLGAVFSVMKYFLIAGLLLLLFDQVNGAFSLVGQDYLDSSFFYSPLDVTVQNVFPYLHDMFANL